ncbi:MAG: hypothetical protein IPH01_10755 [Elusimicrobia bacterium]|nr:hypothetical protein [Elusimicrobiota bacterium]
MVAFGLAQGQPPLRVSLLRALLPPPLAALAGPFHHVPALVGLMLFGLLTVGLGRAVLRRWRPLCFNFPETIGLSLAIGAGLLSAGVWCLGATGGLNTTGVAAITVLGLGVVAFDWTQHPPQLPRFRLGRVDGPTLLLWALPVAVLGITGLFALGFRRRRGFAVLGRGERARNRFRRRPGVGRLFSTPVVAFALPRAGWMCRPPLHPGRGGPGGARARRGAPGATRLADGGAFSSAGPWGSNTPTSLGVGSFSALATQGLPRPSMARFLAGLTIAFMPWVVKNLVGYGNPVFPFLQGWWNPAGFPWTPAP